MSATFLLTGFEPFGEHRTNSSWDALVRLAPSWPKGIVARRLPVDHRGAHDQLRLALAELRPRAVLLTGLAKGRVFRMEERARRPSQLATEPGADELEGRWPWDEMQRALEETGVHAVRSNDAGQYVCESTYWSLLSYGGPLPLPEFAGFLHVPHESEEHGISTIALAVGQVVNARWLGLSGAPPHEA
jgi:pyroglutamyl-peptidase